MENAMHIMTFEQIALKAGFRSEAGKFNLPANQEVADALGSAAMSLLPVWEVGMDPIDVTVTGAAPTWGWMRIAHSLHGTVRSLTYSAPNCPAIVIFAHGK